MIIKYIEPMNYKVIMMPNQGFIHGFPYETIYGHVEIIDPLKEDLIAIAYTRCDRD